MAAGGVSCDGATVQNAALTGHEDVGSHLLHPQNTHSSCGQASHAMLKLDESMTVHYGGTRMRIRMKVLGLVSVSVLAAFVATGCLAPQSAGEPSDTGNSLLPHGVITIQQSANVIVAHRSDPRLVLLDIRTAAEVEAGHLSGASNLDFHSDTFKDELAALSRDRIYLIYCRTGNRTGQVYQMMEEMGFEQVYDMGGGITQWMAAGYPICFDPLDAEHNCTAELPTL